MKRKIRITAILTFLITSVISVKAQNADDIKGVWLTGEKKGQVRVFKATNGKYYGKIEWLKEVNREDGSPKIDDKNPDESKRNEPLLGLLMLKGFSFDEHNKEWTGGTIYDPKNGSTYKCIIWFEDGNLDILHVKGYVGLSFIGKETEWTREPEIRK